MRKNKPLKPLFLTIVLFAFLACAPSDSKTVRQADYGNKWPLTVPEATLLCKEANFPGLRFPLQGVYLYVNERYYPANGTASNKHIIDQYNIEPIYDLEEIWAVDEEMMGDVRKAYEYTGEVIPPDEPLVRISIGPLIQDGLKLCD